MQSSGAEGESNPFFPKGKTITFFTLQSDHSSMSLRCPARFACSVLLVLILLGTGCTTTLIGDVTYRNSSLLIPVTNTGEPRDAFIQVTMYEIKDLHQQEMQVIQEPVTLTRGENEAIIPVTLPPGSYKLYVYILTPGERQTATIRDIVV